jgi:hypothetical protein
VKRVREIGRWTRDEDGVTVSCSTDDGEQWTVPVQMAGTPTDALLVACAIIDRRATREGRAWFVDCISTPQSIYQDMKGLSRGDAKAGGQPRMAMYHERQWLSRIGRKDLLRIPEFDRHEGSVEEGFASRLVRFGKGKLNRPW